MAYSIYRFYKTYGLMLMAPSMAELTNLMAPSMAKLTNVMVPSMVIVKYVKCELKSRIMC